MVFHAHCFQETQSCQRIDERRSRTLRCGFIIVNEASCRRHTSILREGSARHDGYKLAVECSGRVAVTGGDNRAGTFIAHRQRLIEARGYHAQTVFRHGCDQLGVFKVCFINACRSKERAHVGGVDRSRINTHNNIIGAGCRYLNIGNAQFKLAGAGDG